MTHATDSQAAHREPHGAPHLQPPNSIRDLQSVGQSVWLDYMTRSLFTSGEFRRLIVEDGLRGATSNPAIFEKAIAGSPDYLDALHGIGSRGDLEPMALYEALAMRDIRDAADLPTAVAPDRGCPAAHRRAGHSRPLRLPCEPFRHCRTAIRRKS